MEHQPQENNLQSEQYERQCKDEANIAAKGLTHYPSKDGVNKEDSPHDISTSNQQEKHSHEQHHSEDDKPTDNMEEGLYRYHEGSATSVKGPPTTKPAVTMSAM